MKSHAKASSAGSTQRQGLRRQPRRSAALAAVLALTLLATTCLLPSSALAVETRLPLESFGPDGTSGTSFEYAHALAFDQGNQRLYALDQGPAKINGFDASSPGTHTPLGGNFPLSAEGSAYEYVDDLAVDSTSHNIYFSSEAKAFAPEPSLFGFDSSGTGLGGNFPIGGFLDPCGAAVDPSGNVWVSDYFTESITQYDSSGNPIGSVNTSTQGHACHLAFDSEANLYASMYEGAIWKYTAASGYTTASKVDPLGGTYPFASNMVTVDRSSDDLYVIHSDHISVYDSSGAFLYEFGATVAGAQYVGIAVNQATDEIYASDFGNEAIQVFGPPVPLPGVRTEDAEDITTTTATLNGTVNPNGKALTDCHFDFVPDSQFDVDQYESLTTAQQAPCVPAAASIPADSNTHAVKADISGLTSNTTYHFRLLASSAEGIANGPDRTFTTAIGAPVIGSQSVEAVGFSEATLSAKINPKGAKTTYHVEYGPTEAYGQSSAESLPIGFASDDSDHTVSVHIGGLTPGAAYHFRFVATSPAGSAEGTDTSFFTYVPPPSFGPCSNDQFRSGLGARLPDCRAYEQATPVDKHGANIQGGLNLIQAASGGDRVTFYIVGGLPTSGGSSGLAPHMALRGPTGWSSDGLLPATEPGQSASVRGWSEDLSTTVATAPGPGNIGGALYLRDSDTGALQLGFSSSAPLEGVSTAGFASDTSHLIFESNRALLPSVPADLKPRLYELDHGTLTLADRIPVGSATSCDDASGPACVPAPEGSFAGPYDFYYSELTRGGARERYYTQNTISRDGSRVFFTAAGSARLYVREDGTRTTQVSASQRTVPDPNGQKPAAFLAATPDGSKVFFMSCEKLTDDSTAVSTAASSCTTTSLVPGIGQVPDQGQDLYSYDVDTGELTDLTVDSNVGDPKGAAVQGVLGISDDGSYVYFVSNGVLAPGASPGECRGGANVSCNLYLSHGGTTTFVASLDSGNHGDGNDWLPKLGFLAHPKDSRVSADGRTLLFSSVRSLTGYDNIKATAGGICTGSFSAGVPCEELFRYSSPEDELLCVSCNPTGVPPNDGAVLGTEPGFLHEELGFTFLTRNLSADGDRVFFDSRDALLPTDTNGVKDVYEWEAEGSGSCRTAGGCIYLLSSGTSPDPSYFADASADGDDAFFFTSQQLVPFDRDQLIDVYDAGVGDGLPSQHQLSPPTCTSLACQANPAPPPEQTPASASFSGPGNAHEGQPARRCPKGKRKVRRAGKIRCQKAHKQHKRHNNRGGSK